jgi:hypothetical protein
MKKGLCFVAILVLAAQLSLWGYDTSPSDVQIVPEVIWAAATGGGTWVTEIQITNFAAEPAIIEVWFDYSGGSRGNIILYTGLAQYHSVRFSNILSQLQTLDSSFTYYGRVGALTLEGSPGLIQVQAKTVNGNYGKTFPGLNLVAGNTAAIGRPMIIQGLAQNATYRTSVGVFDEEGSAPTVQFTIVDANNSTVGSTFSKTLPESGFLSFNPFVQAGVPSGTYENCWLLIEMTATSYGTGGLMCFGSIANNYTNDTYALIAKTYDDYPWVYETSPTFCKVVPEVIWAAATGGGTWVTEVEITNFGPLTTGIEIYFESAGAWSGEIQLHPGLEKDHSVRYSNILAAIDALDPDPDFSYYGRVGALMILATDQTNRIQVQAKTVNGNFGKTFPGLTYNIEGTTAAQNRPMIIQDLVKDSTYRTSIGVFNTSSNYNYVARFTIFDANHVQVGSPFEKTITLLAFQSFNPFTQAGITTGNYDNCWLYVEVISGGSDTQALMLYGSLANNYTNDTYALMAKQYGTGSDAPPGPPVRF